MDPNERDPVRPETPTQAAIEGLETAILTLFGPVLMAQPNGQELVATARAALLPDNRLPRDEHQRQVWEHADWMLAMLAAGMRAVGRE